MCQSWTRMFVHVTTIKGETNACRVKVINMNLDDGNSIKADILVTHKRLVGYDLLIGMNMIKEMGVVQITPLGAAEFQVNHSYMQR